MATPYLKSWTPTTTYEFNLVIDNKDYSNDLTRLTIKSSVATPYQNVSFELFLDPTDVIENKIYGESKITLTIILKAKTHSSDQQIIFELMFLRLETPYKSVRSVHLPSGGEQKERESIVIETVIRNAYTTMNKNVNELFIGKTPEQIITSLVQNNTDAKLEYDTNGKNPLVIDQFLAPPSTLYQVIKYLDRTYGVFKGDMSVNCFFDNTVRVQNLSKKIQSDQAFTVYQLATDVDQRKIFESNDPKQFYTKEPVRLINRGNAIISSIGKTRNYIVKPSNQLFTTISKDSNDTAVNNGIISKRGKNIKVHYDSKALERNIYITNETGYNTDDSFAIASMTRSLEDVGMLSIGLQDSLPLLNLMKIGSSVKFITQISDYKPFGGMYVLRTSDIGFIRSKVWESWARIIIMRANIIES